MIYKLFPVALFLLFSIYTTNKNSVAPLKSHLKEIACDASANSDSNIELTNNKLNSNQFYLPKRESFKEAMQGFNALKEQGLVKKNILTLIDFSLSSNVKRLWVIDLETNTVLYNSLVSHGRNTGKEFANNFSNANSSFKSSLGFYITGEVYIGKHGTSLKLDGLEKGINDHARLRGVVIHAANYVSNSFIKRNKILGRSLGCPAIPQELLSGIVNSIKDKSCLFIYHPSRSLENKSPLFS